MAVRAGELVAKVVTNRAPRLEVTFDPEHGFRQVPKFDGVLAVLYFLVVEELPAFRFCANCGAVISHIDPTKGPAHNAVRACSANGSGRGRGAVGLRVSRRHLSSGRRHRAHAKQPERPQTYPTSQRTIDDHERTCVRLTTETL